MGKSKTLDLQKYSLGAIPEEVFGCAKAEELIISSDAVMDKESVYLDEEFWWEVGFDNNGIGKIPDAIGELVHLRRIEAAQNYISFISPDIGKLQDLEYLDLCNNYLTYFPLGITKLKNLKILNLNYNSIQSLPPEIRNMESLQELHLNSNQLTELPPEIGKLKNLRVLDLGNFDPDKIYAETRERFDLTMNTLSSLPEEFGDLKNLEFLDLSFNKFTEPPECMTRLVNLQECIFRGNCFHNEAKWLLDEFEYHQRPAPIWWYHYQDAPWE
ncbi:MAG: leucine-rich repeat domain-containing protein [Spirochaetia bacterium]